MLHHQGRLHCPFGVAAPQLENDLALFFRRRLEDQAPLGPFLGAAHDKIDGAQLLVDLPYGPHYFAVNDFFPVHHVRPILERQ